MIAEVLMLILDDDNIFGNIDHIFGNIDNNFFVLSPISVDWYAYNKIVGQMIIIPKSGINDFMSPVVRL